MFIFRRHSFYYVYVLKKVAKVFLSFAYCRFTAESEDSLLFGIQNCGKPDTMNHKALILHLHSLFQRGISFDPLSFSACNEQYLRI
jgi:hypothetical protein